MTYLERLSILERIARLEDYAIIALERGDHAAACRYADRIDALCKSL